MDFLGPLPHSKKGNNMILVIVDRLTKMAHFIPTKHSITARGTAELFVQHVFVRHGLPDSIVSDRDPRFTANFWNALARILQVTLKMSTAEHPQTDGQTEATVKTIQKLLRPFCLEQQDWEEIIPQLEFAYNDTPHATTHETPFRLNHGYNPRSTMTYLDTGVPHAEDFLQYLGRLQEIARDAMHAAQSNQEYYANRHRRQPETIKPGDWVLILRKKSQITKLSPIADGPFEVLSIGRNTVTVKFPPHTKAHPTINVSRIRHYIGPRSTIPASVPEDELPEYGIIDKLIAQRRFRGSTQYLVHWLGYPAEDDEWVNQEDITPDAVTTFRNQRNQARTRPGVVAS
jgi:Chromo (CHRromatin Organisation MOdifier) domain